jgi:hypothetical protein
MSRLTQVIVLSASVLAVFQTATAYALQPLGAPLGLTLGGNLGTSLPFAGGGVLAVAAAAVVVGIFVKRRQR